MENDMEKIMCPWCESLRTDFFVAKNNCDVYRCKNCRLLFVFPIPTNVSVYDKDYFAGAEDGFGYVDYDSDKEPMVPTFVRYLKEIKKLGVTGGKLLDVGAATGFFMHIAEKEGFDTTGVELSDFAAGEGRKKGLNILTSTLENAQFPAESFEVVTMCDVLEHVTDPKGFLLEAVRVLKRGGLMVINTPNAESLVAGVLGPRWHLIVPPEHLHYFSPRNLGNYLEKEGCEVAVSTTIGKRFTLTYIFKTLYKWQHLRVWNILAGFFGNKSLAGWYIPLNTHDNFFMIVRKK